jgi:hypothetical protein
LAALAPLAIVAAGCSSGGHNAIETKADIGRPRCDAPNAVSTLVVSTSGAAT